jgi:Death domain
VCYTAVDSSSHCQPPKLSQPQLPLTVIADAVNGDWPKLARALGVTECDVSLIRQTYSYVGEQALVMLHGWLASRVRHGNGIVTMNHDLARALHCIGRSDVVNSHLGDVTIKDDCQISIDRG